MNGRDIAKVIAAGATAAQLGTAFLCCDEAGTPIRTTLNQEETAMYATHLGSFGTKARSAVRDLDPQNDLTFLRIRTKKHEMMVAPEKDFLLIVVQDPNSE